MESQSSPLSGHIVMLCVPAWGKCLTTRASCTCLILILAPGHQRPLASLACKIVKERTDVAITFFCVALYYKKLQCEIDRYFSTSVADSEAKANIRPVACIRQLYHGFP